MGLKEYETAKIFLPSTFKRDTQIAGERAKKYANTFYNTFGDYKKNVFLAAGLGSTCSRINKRLIEKHEVYFEQAFNHGYAMAIKEINELLLVILFYGEAEEPPHSGVEK